MKEVLDIIHKTIYQFFDVCGDDEEVPLSDKDKLLLEVNKAICNNLKALDPQPKTGHWIKYGIPRCGEQHYKCTNCDEYFNFGLYSDYYKKAFKYCPNCGAKMVEPQESEERNEDSN